jgi:hypothetical protein
MCRAVLICAPFSLPVQLLPPLAEQTQVLQLQQRNTGRNALAPARACCVDLCADFLPVQLLPPLAEQTQALQLQHCKSGCNALAPARAVLC